MLHPEVLEFEEQFDEEAVVEHEQQQLLITRGLLKDKTDWLSENRRFMDMNKCGLSMLSVMADQPSLLDSLKTLILNVEEQIRKYNIQHTLPSADNLDLFGIIDTLETLLYLGDHKQYAFRKNRLKRHLAEWAPVTYLIEGGLKELQFQKDPAIDPDASRQLNKRLQQYYTLRNRMVQANLRLVYSVANRFRHLGVAFEDLVQEGHLGLIKAVERFEVEKGFRFSTYAHIVISQAIHLAIDKQSAIVRLPFKALREKATVDKTRQALEQRLGRNPTSAELSALLSDELEYKATHLANLVEPNASTQDLYSSPDDTELLEDLPLGDQDTKTSSMTSADLAGRVLSCLDERESYIIRMRFGIGLPKEYTLEEISQTIGLSRERVRQLSHKAVDKLASNFSQMMPN